MRLVLPVAPAELLVELVGPPAELLAELAQPPAELVPVLAAPLAFKLCDVNWLREIHFELLGGIYNA